MTKADTPRASVSSTRARKPAAKSKRTSAPAGKPETLASVADIMRALGRQAREAAWQLALAPTDAKNAALLAAAREIRAQTATIIAENGRDLAAATETRVTAAFLDRLALDPKRIEAMAKGLEEIAALPDPVGSVIARWTRPNGLAIERVRVPLGVIGIVYESRPNVTADAGALSLKAGNAAIQIGRASCRERV